MKEKGYKVKCTSLEKQFVNHSRKEGLEGMVRKNVRCIPERVGCTPEKKRIVFKVSEEVAQMWEEIVRHEREQTQKGTRYYLAHTMQKLIRSRYELLKAFGE